MALDMPITSDGEWEEDELAGLCKDECMRQLDVIKAKMAKGQDVVWYNKTLLNTMDLYVAVFGDVCLCDQYDEIRDLESFEVWAANQIRNTINMNKYKHYVEG